MESSSVAIDRTFDTAGEQDGALLSSQRARRYFARTILWLAVLGTYLWLARGLPAFRELYPNRGGHALAEGYAALLTVGLVYCLWVQYCVNAERRILFAIIALSGAGTAFLAHGIAGAPGQLGGSMLGRVATCYCFGWQIACAGLLAMAAADQRIDDLESVRRRGGRSVISCLIFSVCLAVCLPLLAKYGLRVQEALPFGLGAVWERVKQHAIRRETQDALVLAATSVAVLVVARAHSNREDAFSGSLTVFVSFMVLSHLANLASIGDYSVMWWSSHVLRIAGIFLLLVYLAKEFGASYADAQSRISHLEAVHYMSSSLSNTLDLRVVLLAMVSDTARMLSATYASVMLANEEGSSLTTYVTHGLPDMPLNPRQAQSVEGRGRPDFYCGHTAKAFNEKRIVVVDDVYSDVEFIPWRVLAETSGYAVSVPLVYQDVALGVLNLFFSSHVPLNDEKMRLFQTVASAAAVAIANAQLYERSLAGDLSPAVQPAAFRQMRLVS